MGNTFGKTKTKRAQKETLLSLLRCPPFVQKCTHHHLSSNSSSQHSSKLHESRSSPIYSDTTSPNIANPDLCMSCKLCPNYADFALCQTCIQHVTLNAQDVLDTVKKEIKERTQQGCFTEATQAKLPFLQLAQDPYTTKCMPMHEAVRANDRLPFVQAMVSAGHRVDQYLSIGETPLMIASSNNAYLVLQWMLEQVPEIKYSLDVKTNEYNPWGEGCTALHFAAVYGHKRCYDLLLQHGADESRRNGKGQTPAQLIKW